MYTCTLTQAVLSFDPINNICVLKWHLTVHGLQVMTWIWCLYLNVDQHRKRYCFANCYMYCVCNSNLSLHSASPKVYKFFFRQYQKFEWVAMMSYQSGQKMYYSTLLLLQSIFFCLLTEWSLCPAVEKFNSRSLWYRARQYWFFTPQSTL